MQSQYDREMAKPMWQELENIGVKPLTTPEEVDETLTKTEGSTLLVVNSVCGCAAGNARPGVAMALQHKLIPDNLATVFAGVDLEATAKAREYIKGYPASSPSITLFKEGKVVAMLERHQIEGVSAQGIAETLKAEFDKHCTKEGPSVSEEVLKQAFGIA